MVCLNPKIAYQRRHMPIDGNITKRNLKRLNKISFVYHKGWRQIELPCGECPACRLAKANEWATRIECESKTWKGKGIFVTLTYNNNKLPIVIDGKSERNGTNKEIRGLPTLRKKDVQDYKKRLRKHVKKHNEAISFWENPRNGKTEKIIRTFECGEYGPTTGRPHYHQIIFNWIPNDLEYKETSKDGYPLFKSKTLQKIWQNGFVLIGMISYESASYVARYTMKKCGLAKVKREYYDEEAIDEETGEIYCKHRWHNIKGIIEPEFLTMSTAVGLGAKYFVENQKNILENNGIMINVKGTVKLRPIPRYFRKIMEKQNWEKYEHWKVLYQEEIKERIRKKIETYILPKEWEYWKKEIFVKQEMLDNIKHKFNLLKRNNILYDGDEEDNIKVA